MNKTQALRAIITLEDVFTLEGDAVVIASERISKRRGVEGVKVSGKHGGSEWIPLDELIAKEDI